jgi:hypothetical protein
VPRSVPDELSRQARDQGGFVTVQQVLASGMSRAALRWRLRTGQWQRRGRGVIRTVTGESSREAVLWEAVQQAGPGAMLSHQSAAETHGFADEQDTVIHITVASRRRPGQHVPPRGIVIHRSDQSRPDPHQPAWHPPRTSAEDTVLDLVTAARTFDDAYGWISRAVGRHATAPASLREALARRKRIRWRVWLTEALGESGQGIDSPLERRYVRGVERAHGLPEATRQAKRRAGEGNIYLDNLYQPYGVCVELDGMAAHPQEGRWADTHRDNANIADSGIQTMRYNWPDATEKRCDTAAEIARALRRRGWEGTIRPCGPSCPGSGR